MKAVQDLPILTVTGAEDALVSIRSAQTMASKFVDSVSLVSTYRTDCMLLSFRCLILKIIIMWVILHPSFKFPAFEFGIL